MHKSEYETRKEEARQRWLKRLQAERSEAIQRRQKELEEEIAALVAETERTRRKLGPLYRLVEHGRIVDQALREIIGKPYISESEEADVLLGSLKSLLLDPAVDHIMKRFQEGFGTGTVRILTENTDRVEVVEPPTWPPIPVDHPFIPSLYGTTHPLHKQALIELTRSARENRIIVNVGSSDQDSNPETDPLRFSLPEATALFQYLRQLLNYGLALIENDFVWGARRPQEYYDSELEKVGQEFDYEHLFPF